VTRVSINLNPSNLGANFSLLDPPLFSIEDDLDEPFKTTNISTVRIYIELTIKCYNIFYPEERKRTSTTGEEGGADDDKATVETVRTEATRVHEPFMFS
jgi:hypothetical protein